MVCIHSVALDRTRVRNSLQLRNRMHSIKIKEEGPVLLSELSRAYLRKSLQFLCYERDVPLRNTNCTFGI
jgi:hypothetical protein